jgi:RHS repeat-associated protein
VAETVGGIATKYLVEDDVNPTGLPQVFDETVNGAVTRTYSYGFQRIGEDQMVSGTWTPSFYEYDGAGSVRQLTNPAGAVTDSYNYDAFGNLLNSTGTTPNNYLYRGEQYDANLNLYYLRARFYNPATDRFLSRDPNHGYIGWPSSLHKYAYASADPVDRVDPMGREDMIEVGGADEAVTDEAVEEGLTNVKDRVDCILDTTAATPFAMSEADWMRGR